MEYRCVRGAGHPQLVDRPTVVTLDERWAGCGHMHTTSTRCTGKECHANALACVHSHGAVLGKICICPYEGSLNFQFKWSAQLGNPRWAMPGEILSLVCHATT